MFGKKKAEEWNHGVYLTTAKNSMEADILESKLRAEDIPCIRRYDGAGNFMEIALGSNTTQDIDFYVPPEKLADAKEIIVAVPIDDDFEEAED